MKQLTIFIIEDDIALAQALKNYLDFNQYRLVIAEDFNHIMETYNQVQPHLILMDINLPYYDGFYWCMKIREHHQIPIIFISSSNNDHDKIMAMMQGADDYIEKPFNLPLLKAKIEALLRRCYQYQIEKSCTLAPDLDYDYHKSQLIYKDNMIDLTKSENVIMHTLLLSKGKIVSRNILMDELWNTDEFISDNTLTVLISRLRNKIKEATNKQLIQTKKGQGYFIE